jgi:hypothetical protein
MSFLIPQLVPPGRRCPWCKLLIPDECKSGDDCPHCGEELSYASFLKDASAWFLKYLVIGFIGGMVLAGIVVYLFRNS